MTSPVECTQRMGRKKRHDLRDFWPWYERQWHTESPSRPRPFGLSDLERTPENTSLGSWFLLAALALCGLLCLAFVVWTLLGRFGD
jgi:hypothetical protein